MFWPNFLLLLLLFLVVVVPGCCSWLLLLVVVVVVAWCLLVPVVCWCLLVPVGACWCLLVPVGACWRLLVVLVGGCCLCGGGCVQDFWASHPDPPPPDRPSPGPPKISLFFSCLPPEFSFFLLSLGVFSLNFCGVFEDRDALMCTFGLSGCRVKPQQPHQTGPLGLVRTRQPENSKRAHFRAPALQTPPKFHERTPRERKKNEISGGREQKKREILGLPPFWAPPF